MLFSHLLLVGFAAFAVPAPSPSPHQNSEPPAPAPLSFTRIISAVEGQAKVERLNELLTSFIEKVKANEPGTQVFELDLDRDKSQFLTFEVYEDQEAIDAHLKSSYLAELLASEEKEQLKRAENEIFTLELIKRFIRDPVESNV